jgi:hypothetical protein
VLPDERLPDLLAAAEPAKRTLFRKPPDAFEPYLSQHARELSAFPFSGRSFLTLDLFLAGQGLGFSEAGSGQTSDALSRARGSYWQVIPAEAARSLRVTLGGASLDADALSRFVESEYGPNEARQGTEAVLAAFAALNHWLSEVPPGSSALLSLG